MIILQKIFFQRKHRLWRKQSCYNIATGTIRTLNVRCLCIDIVRLSVYICRPAVFESSSTNESTGHLAILEHFEDEQSYPAVQDISHVFEYMANLCRHHSFSEFLVCC